MKEYLKEHPDFMVEVEQKVREHYQLQTDEYGKVVLYDKVEDFVNEMVEKHLRDF